MHDAPLPVEALFRSLPAAWRGMAARLFRPFDLSRWLALGFTAWLSVLGQGGCSADFGTWNRDTTSTLQNVRETVVAHAGIFGSLGLLALVLAAGVLLALLWIRCRGTFMFLDNVVRDRADVAAPWRAWAEPAHSLWWWSLAFYAAAFLALLLALAPLAAAAVMWWRGEPPAPAFLRGALVAAPLLLLWALAVAYVQLFLGDFVVPLMHRGQLTARAAWRQFGALWHGQVGVLLLYGIVRFALGAVIAAAVMLAGLLTCCCLFLLLLLPYVYAVVLLPVFVFLRLYSLEVLRCAGPAFDPWTPPQPPALPDTQAPA